MAGCLFTSPFFMPYKDREKGNEYKRHYYRTVYAEKQKAYVKDRYERQRKQFEDWKSTLSCIKCGENDAICLEFHHVDPRTKDGNPSEMLKKKGWTFERLHGYLALTCLVLCANCHRKAHRHIKQINEGKPLRTKAKKRRYTSRPK
jgi:L-lactate utilization protein LutB